ncbi:hypothetical protein CK934_10625 [Chitinophaga sp. MD30]|nr:hypothetical protein CK934_10625 [Chitinophaga sp. MD30]
MGEASNTPQKYGEGGVGAMTGAFSQANGEVNRTVGVVKGERCFNERLHLHAGGPGSRMGKGGLG